MSEEIARTKPWVFFLCTALLFSAAVVVIANRLPKPKEVFPSQVQERLQKLESFRLDLGNAVGAFESRLAALEQGAKADRKSQASDLEAVRADLAKLSKLEAEFHGLADHGERLAAVEEKLDRPLPAAPAAGDWNGAFDGLREELEAKYEAIAKRLDGVIGPRASNQPGAKPVDTAALTAQVVEKIKEGGIRALLPSGTWLPFDPVLRLRGRQIGRRTVPEGWETSEAFGERLVRAAPNVDVAGESSEGDTPASYGFVFVKPKDK